MEFHGFDQNVMRKCPIKTIYVPKPMLSGSRKPTIQILASKKYCTMGHMQITYLICHLNRFFHSSEGKSSIKTIKVSNYLVAWPMKPKKILRYG